MSDLKVLEKEYPCLAAVNRCANSMRAYLVLISFTFEHKIFMYCSSSANRCTPSPGQSHQAAVLWRRTDPEDTHVGGEGEMRFNCAGKYKIDAIKWPVSAKL